MDLSCEFNSTERIPRIAPKSRDAAHSGALARGGFAAHGHYIDVHRPLQYECCGQVHPAGVRAVERADRFAAKRIRVGLRSFSDARRMAWRPVRSSPHT